MLRSTALAIFHRGSRKNETMQQATARDWICLKKYLRFSHFAARPCHDLILTLLCSSLSLLPFKCFPHLFVSVAVNQM